ncbi:MAG: PEP-CTERM sorting domain-containing protein [Microcystis sp. LE19-338.1B]|jgi:hypothetical protein|nr:PEP-CTERM sorting domain-containing protein [Microcystis sp. LE19-338.1B]MCZ8360732.1 PEP-CTERM sorting domain-containing protein [Microcystis sp. LE19-388.1G]
MLFFDFSKVGNLSTFVISTFVTLGGLVSFSESTLSQPLMVSFPIAPPTINLPADPVIDLHLFFQKYPLDGFTGGPKPDPVIIFNDGFIPDPGQYLPKICMSTSSPILPNVGSLKCDYYFPLGISNGPKDQVTLKVPLICDQLEDCVDLKQSYWTTESKPTPQKGAEPVKPFKPTPSVEIRRNSPLQFTFANSYASSLTYSNLFLYTSIPLSQFSSIDFDVPLANSPIVWSDTFTLAPGDSISFSFDSLVEPQDTYSLLTGSTFLADDPNNIAQFSIATNPTESPVSCTVPEPTATLSFLVLGTLGFASTLKRQLKPSKSTEKELTKVA